MKVTRALTEIAFLFSALFLIAPYVPSHEGFVHAFGVQHALAVAIFGIGRALRWQERWWFAVPEAAAFAAFAWVLVASYNLT